MKDRPTLLGMAAAIAIGCGLLVFAAEGVLRVVMPHWQEFYSGRFMHVVQVPEHGLVTTGRPGFDGYFSQNNGDFRVRLQINDFGFRNPDPVNKADGRIWFIGDSMAFGWGVEQNEMYSSVAGALLNAPTYNVASPGTNVCGYQALLARTLKHASPRAVIVGLILENDIGDYDCRAEAQSSSAEAVQPGADISASMHPRRTPFDRTTKSCRSQSSSGSPSRASRTFIAPSQGSGTSTS